MKMLLALISLLIYLPGLVYVQPPTARFAPGLCPFEKGSTYQIDCGYLTMPEDHAAPDGAYIRLAIAIVHSPNVQKRPDPVLFLQGGPGADTLNIAPTLLRSSSMARILQQRDLILVDQRGMGFSEPALYCTIFDAPQELITLTPHQLTERVNRCPSQLEARGIRWQHFTTAQNAADLAHLGPALGYPKVNLFGVSYGTLLGLIILRDHPEIVRSAVLDSVMPPGPSIIEQSARWNADMFARVERDCQADWLCHWAYPNMRVRLLETYQHLKAQPATISVDEVSLPLSAHFFAQHSWIGGRADAEQLPAFINAFTYQDYTIVQPFLTSMLKASTADMPKLAVFETMSCPYHARNTTPERIAAAFAPYAESFQDGRFTLEDWQRCAAWSELAPESLDLPYTDVPVLLLSGAYDAIAPPEWGRYAAQGLPYAQVVEVPYTGHSSTFGGGAAEFCTTGMLADFYEVPTHAVDRSCLSAIPAPTFLVHSSVTRIPLGVLLLPLLLASAAGLFSGLVAWRKRPDWTAWRTACRRAGFLPILAGGLVLSITLLLRHSEEQEWLWSGAASILVLCMALQAALLISPDDEPVLEVTLAAPRPLAWLLVERFVVLGACYVLMGGICALVRCWLDPSSLHTEPLIVTVLGWIAPALFLSATGLYLTLRTRMATFGVVAVLALWVFTGLFGRFFLPNLALSFPLNLIQPFLWAFHIHAGWHDLPQPEYLINRLMLGSIGIVLILRSLHLASDSERMLLNPQRQLRGSSRRSLEPGEQPYSPTLRPSRLAQIAGIAYYELLMLWRQRASRVLVLSPITVFGMLIVLNIFDRIVDPASVAYLTTAERSIIHGDFLVWALAPFVLALVLWGLPLLVAGMVPADRQLGVSEWLHALPLAEEIYLSGKIVGAALASIFACILIILACDLLWLLRVGPFIIGPLLGLTVLCLLLLPWTVILGVVLGATQTSTVRALALAIILLIVPELLQMIPAVHQLLPAQSEWLNHLMGQVHTALISRPPYSSINTALSGITFGLYSSLALKALFVLLAAWAWLSRKGIYD